MAKSIAFSSYTVSANACLYEINALVFVSDSWRGS